MTPFDILTVREELLGKIEREIQQHYQAIEDLMIKREGVIETLSAVEKQVKTNRAPQFAEFPND